MILQSLMPKDNIVVQFIGLLLLIGNTNFLSVKALVCLLFNGNKFTQKTVIGF